MKSLGIILAGGGSSKLGELSEKRAVAAMPVAGSYRCIDFALSSMSNSHIQKVAVFTQYNARSLNQHLSSSKWWDLGRKQGGLFLLTPTVTSQNDSWFLGTADAMHQNIDFLRDCHEPYVIISSGDCVYKADFDKMLQYHIDKNADVTLACTTLAPERDDLTRFGIIETDEKSRIVRFEEKPAETEGNTINTGIYVIRRRLLIDLLDRADKEHESDFVKDILIQNLGRLKIYAFPLPGYWSNIATVDSYYRTNMDFLNEDVRNYFFSEYRAIYSKETDEPPAKFNPGACLRHSLVSSGCILNGSVEDSILFRKVFIGNNCAIRNSILLDDVYIGDGATVENCIVESHSTLRPGTIYRGDGTQPRVVVESNERYVF